MKTTKKLLTLLLAAAMLTTTACQRTPENPIVVPKDDEQMIEKAGGKDANNTDGKAEVGENAAKFGSPGTTTPADLVARLNVPDRYVISRNYMDERITLEADATITVPKYAMPVVRVEAADFTQDLVNRMYDVLIGDTPMYQFQQPRMTKSELEDALEITKEWLAQAQEDLKRCQPNCIPTCISGFDIPCESYKRQIKDSERSIEAIKEAIKTAPDIADNTPDRSSAEIKKHYEYDWTRTERTGEYYGFRLSDRVGDNWGGVQFELTNNGSKWYANEDHDDHGGFWGYRWGGGGKGASLKYTNSMITDYNSSVWYNKASGGWGFSTSGGAHFEWDWEKYGMKGMSEEELQEYYKASNAFYEANPQPVTELIETVRADNYTELSGAKPIFGYGDAVKMVQAFLNDIGVEDMMPDTLTMHYVTEANLVDYGSGIDPNTGGKADTSDIHNKHIAALKNGEFDDKIHDTQVLVSLVRHYNGIPVSVSTQTQFSYTEMHNQPWQYETFFILVCKSGIIGIDWESPHKIIETVVTDSEMISFAEVANIFETMFRVKYSGHLSHMTDISGAVNVAPGTNLSLSHAANVTHVTLSLRRVTEQNNIEQGLLVPVWDFYGVIKTTTYNNGVAYPHINSTAEGEPLMTVNAIDGRIIDLAKGY